MKKIITILLLISSACLAKDVENTEEKSIPTISVKGNGVLSVAPDILKIDSVVRTMDTNLQRGSLSHKNRVNTILEKLENKGVLKKNISVQNYSVNLINDIKDKKKITNYNISTELVINFDDIKKASEIVDILIENGITDIRNVEFSIKNKKEFEEQSYRLAYEDAKLKANYIAKMENAILTPKEIHLNNNFRTPLMFKSILNNNFKDINNAQQDLQLTIPTNIEISTNVDVVFYLDK